MTCLSNSVRAKILPLILAAQGFSRTVAGIRPAGEMPTWRTQRTFAFYEVGPYAEPDEALACQKVKKEKSIEGRYLLIFGG